MEALGTWLDEKSRSEASVFTGSPRVMLCIFATKALLCDPKIPVKKRIRGFYASCGSSVLHGAERAGVHPAHDAGTANLGAWQASVRPLSAQKTG